ncbi:MAG: sulfatase-like hydrolase/transferase [Luteitalea sp.]|nr:sulfatase-like hydrolase/transferase [Luteitalea sp.]
MRLLNRITLNILLLIGAFHIAAAEGRFVQEHQTSPNIILLVTDDQRWDTLGAYGNAVIRTPNIDRLAVEGVLFENMFVTTSICAPSRATIMTGQYPSRHRVHDFKTSLTREQLQQTYMGQLKDAGYEIGFIGKWGVGTPPEDFLDYDKTFPGQGQYFHQINEINGEERHLTGLIGDQALEFLDQSSSEMPFMLSISFKAAHVQDSYDVSGDLYQYDPALSDLYRDVEIPMPEKSDPKYFEQLPEFLKNSENRARWAVRFWGPERAQESLKGYYRLISGVDQQVGRIREKLEAKGLAEDTIIIFTSENGMFMGEYGFTGKWYPHEESLRIPLIVHDPRLERSQRGRRLDEMVLTLDMAPTILDLAGVDNRAAMQGRSLVPLLDDEKAEWRTEFFYEHLFEHPKIPATEAIRTERWKYIRYVDQDPIYEQLFDLQTDPNEVEDLMLTDGHDETKEEMRRKWKEWHAKVRE